MPQPGGGLRFVDEAIPDVLVELVFASDDLYDPHLTEQAMAHLVDGPHPALVEPFEDLVLALETFG